MTDYGCKREMTFEEELLAFDARLNELLFAEDEYPGDSLLKSVLRDSKRILSKATAKIEALQMDNKQLESDVINANMNGEHLQAENKRLLKEFLRLKEEIAPPYLLINCDDKSVEVLREALKSKKVSLFSDNDNEATVEFLNKASIKAEAIKEFAERYERYLLSQLTTAPLDKKEWINFCLDELDNLKKEMVGEG